ncbi:protein HEXIM1 [Orussus abietinus]|uniref:protein HEXIM1 n=1 Tax=Orussus abietinus TaxID=222816 RepID=UPI000625CFE0|nr:protein HEXIM1 [Orussus abietinus]
MDVCASSEKQNTLRDEPMDDSDGDAAAGKPSGGEDGLLNVKAVKADPTLAAATVVPPVVRSVAENADSKHRANGKNCWKTLLRRAGKIERSSGSGDQEGHLDEGTDIATKKRKTRRGKPKHRKLKPYSKQQPAYQQRVRCRTGGGQTKTGRQPPAPYNTTQFLIEDHNDLPDLEQKLAGTIASEIPSGPSRTRDSSFSIDSDEDYFYSSPEDEEEFLTKEFSTAYEDLHAERLGAMTKSELIQEYVQLEAKVDLLTKRLRGKNLNPMEEVESEGKAGTTSDSEVAKKLKIYQQRIDDLTQQNEQLRRENEALRARRHGSTVTTTDSEGDSDCTSNGNREVCDCSARSPSLSPVQVSCQLRRDKGQKNISPASSVDSESDSSSSSSSSSDTPCSCHANSPKPSASSSSGLVNGHATSHELDGLPT